MSKTVFITDIQPKTQVNEIFLVKHIALMEARDGRKYLNVILSDKTGDLESRKWNQAESVAEKVCAGDYVLIKGKAQLYQSRLQFIIDQIDKVDESTVDSADFHLEAKTSPEIMFKELLEIVDSLDDVYIKEFLRLVLHDGEISSRLKLWQAGKTIHHAYRGGLLEHILSCTKLAVILSEHYGANKNYVVAGAVLHDIGKIYELTDGNVINYSEEGHLIGHVIKGVEVVERFTHHIDGFPTRMKMHIKHIVLSHHGEYEFGAPKVPSTIEALLVHQIDLMDSKVNSIETAIRSDQQAGYWTNYVRHMDRVLYKGDLPHYTEKVPASQKNASSQNKGQKKSSETPLKQSMADKLKDFKVD